MSRWKSNEEKGLPSINMKDGLLHHMLSFVMCDHLSFPQIETSPGGRSNAVRYHVDIVTTNQLT